MGTGMSATSSASTTLGCAAGSGSSGAHGMSDMSLSLLESTVTISEPGFGPVMPRRHVNALARRSARHHGPRLRSMGGALRGRYITYVPLADCF